MNKYVKLFGVIGLVTALGACDNSNNSNGSGSNGNKIDVSAVVSQVKTDAQKACQFVPTDDTVTKLIGTVTGQSGVVAIASNIVKSICDAVAPKASIVRDQAIAKNDSTDQTYGKVNNVDVVGHFAPK